MIFAGIIIAIVVSAFGYMRWSEIDCERSWIQVTRCTDKGYTLAACKATELPKRCESEDQDDD